MNIDGTFFMHRNNRGLSHDRLKASNTELHTTYVSSSISSYIIHISMLLMVQLNLGSFWAIPRSQRYAALVK